MNSFTRALDKIVAMLMGIGACCLVAMMLITCADVVGRFFNHPIFGTVEIVGFLATLALALAYTHQVKGNIGGRNPGASISITCSVVLRAADRYPRPGLDGGKLLAMEKEVSLHQWNGRHIGGLHPGNGRACLHPPRRPRSVSLEFRRFP